MTHIQRANLVRRIRTEAARGAYIKLGKTNGRLTIHITDKNPPDKSRATTTIYSESDWLAHPLNKLNQPSRRKREQDEALESIKNFTENTAALNVAMGHLTPAAVAAAAAMANLKDKE